MKLQGRIFLANLTLGEAIIVKEETSDSFVKDLEWCFVNLCRNLEIPTPLWLKKNTKEFARFHQTIFFEEQFTEKIEFNRFQINLLKDD